MPNYFRNIIFLLLFLFFIILGINELHAQNKNYGASNYFKVKRVVDGDTIQLENGQKVRYIGINTPESVDPRRPIQCFGKEASNKAKELLNGRTIILESDSTQGDRDEYRRLLRYVFLPDGTNFDEFMIEKGYAHEYTFKGKLYKYRTEFIQAEKTAEKERKGLWGSC